MRAVLIVQFVIGFLCFGVTLSEIGTYNAGVVKILTENSEVKYYVNFIREARKLNIDILLLPHTKGSEQFNNYDKLITSISESAKQSDIYVVAPLLNKIKCNNQYELFDNNVVFDRSGNVISVFRKPRSNMSKCNVTQDSVSFTTDFGVTFKQVNIEDIVLNHPNNFDERNIIVTGDLSSELPIFTLSQYLSSWAQMVGTNVLFGSTLYSGKQVNNMPLDGTTKLFAVEMRKEPLSGQTSQPMPQSQNTKTVLDLSQSTMKTFDMEVRRGLKETLCRNEFCCEFYVKTGEKVNKGVYTLAVYNDLHNFGSVHYIGVQNCAVIVCDSIRESTCVFEAKNVADTIFDEISISGNFSSKNSFQLPIASTSANPLSVGNYDLYSKTMNNNNQISVKLLKPSALSIFGISSRDFSKDFEASKNNDNDDGFTDFSEDLNEFFDYLWIRLRILIFVVSIYVLEMM